MFLIVCAINDLCDLRRCDVLKLMDMPGLADLRELIYISSDVATQDIVWKTCREQQRESGKPMLSEQLDDDDDDDSFINHATGAWMVSH